LKLNKQCNTRWTKTKKKATLGNLNFIVNLSFYHKPLSYAKNIVRCVCNTASAVYRHNGPLRLKIISPPDLYDNYEETKNVAKWQEFLLE